MLRMKSHQRPLLAGLTLAILLSGCSAAVRSTAGSAAPSTAAQTAVAAQPSSVALQPTSAPATQPATDQATGPVQTVLDYYSAINQKQYEQAYRAWASDGAASNQTLDQFKQGFAQTVEVSVLLSSPRQAGASMGSVTVPVTIFAVVDEPSSPTSGQVVRGFGGSYTLVPATSGSGWQIASANISALPSDTGLAERYTDPSRLVQAYYTAINNRELARAYTDWQNPAHDTGQSFAQFYQGFADTSQVEVELGRPQSDAGAGNLYATVPIVINATNSDGTQQSFCGSYQLHRANIEPWNALGWRLEKAQIAPHAAVSLGSEQSRQLLSNGCQ